MGKQKWFSILAAGTMLASTFAFVGGGSYAQGTSQTFPETGKTVSGRFLEYWKANGGLPQQGYPITSEMQEVSATDGKTYTVQYFERAVFEKHPENKAPNDVLLSLLGNFAYKAKYGTAGAPGQKVSTENPTKFSQTNHSVGGKFLAYWNKNGGLAQQGYPISDEFTEKSDLNGKDYTVQYFERAVFELHPENQAPYDVLLSQLGTSQLKAKQNAIAYPTGTGTITLWHGYTGTEADTLAKAVKMLTDKNPGFQVTVLAVPFDSLKQKFTTEAATGGGPDLVIGPSDWIGEFAEAGIVSPLDEVEGSKPLVSGLTSAAVGVATYNGKLYGIPTSMKNVALYYNTDLVKSVPKNLDDMLTQAGTLATGNVKYGLALNAGFYHAVGLNYAFGGKLFTDATHVDLTTKGTIDWLTWLKKAKDSKGVFAKGGADADIDTLFKTGGAAMVVNGPWALGDYQKALGKDKVGVAIVPNTAAGGKFAPFVGTENYYVNAGTKNEKAAVQFVSFIVSAGIGKMFVDAGQISTNPNVDLSANPSLAAFVAQAAQGTAFPNVPAMGKVWDPAGNMITEVLDGKASPADAAKKATDAINAAIAAGGN
ncbi:MAG: extracellular solute-binding protein [Chloroflexota bacterium]